MTRRRDIERLVAELGQEDGRRVHRAVEALAGMDGDDVDDALVERLRALGYHW